MRVLLALALLIPSTAIAAPVTFTFSAGEVSGWYTFDTDTPGVRQRYEGPDVYWNPDGEMLYANAITQWGVSVGDYWSASGTEGELRLAVDRGEFSETWYTAYMWSGPDIALGLQAWTPTSDPIITTEELTAVPDLTGDDTITSLVLFDEQRINVARRYEHLTSLSAAPVEALSAQAHITPVPEPSTLAFLGLGLIAAFSRGYKSRTCGQ